MNSTKTYRKSACARCGIQTTTKPIFAVRLCMACRQDEWYVEKMKDHYIAEVMLKEVG